MDLSLLKDGIYVMCIGMGTVFIFLTIMICAMYLNNKVLIIVNKFFPEEIPAEKKKFAANDNNDAETALAIACAFAKSHKV